MRIVRVFPRLTEATPRDGMVYAPRSGRATPAQVIAQCVPDALVPECDEVHISVAYTYDMWIAEKLYTAWTAVGVPVKMGGPAFGLRSGEHTPGLYIKPGYAITSRGCPNHCWFCSVWRREGSLREYQIKPGHNILDDNLLACSDAHINAVFDMLRNQPHRALFTGGLEAKTLKEWHVARMREVNAERLYFAYDTPDDYDPLIEAGKLLKRYEFRQDDCKCYVLIGYKGDTFSAAERRLKQAIMARFMPYAMLYRGDDGLTDIEWRQFQREWCRPQIVATKFREVKNQ